MSEWQRVLTLEERQGWLEGGGICAGRSEGGQWRSEGSKALQHGRVLTCRRRRTHMSTPFPFRLILLVLSLGRDQALGADWCREGVGLVEGDCMRAYIEGHLLLFLCLPLHCGKAAGANANAKTCTHVYCRAQPTSILMIFMSLRCV